MLLATWNVNSVRARLPRILPWLEDTHPDVVCLQETKCRDEQFPREPFEELGYRVEVYGQKTYNGVAILSKAPIEDVVRGLPGDDDESARRVIGAAIEDVLVLNVYVVNGKQVGTESFAHKLEWMGRLRDFIAEHHDLGEKVVVGGDFNVTFDDRDVHDPDAWREVILCSTPEREALGHILDLGFHDAFRRFHEEGGHYTWWDYRTRGFRRNAGLRIDHLLMSDAALAACTSVEIDRGMRGGEKPSDHSPVLATLQ